MPLLKIADRYVDDKPLCLYDFPRSHKPLWKEFWRALDGDYDKILDFAKKGGVENPVEWLEELHRFLFDVFAGCPELVKKASADAFGKFINKIAEQHIKNPKDKHWYLERGVLPDDFIEVLKEASKLETPKDTILYLNNQIINFGTDLYSEFLLLKTKQSADIKAFASKLTRDAYDMEMSVVGNKHPIKQHLQVGSKFKHKNCGDVTFVYTGERCNTSINRINGTKNITIDSDHPVVFCKDAAGNACAFNDIWNLIPVVAKLDKNIKQLIEKHKGDNPIFKNFKEGLIHALQQDPIDMKLVKEFAADLKLPLKDLGIE